jgi:hypothetical protein
MRLRVGLVVLLLAAALAGCGGDDDNDDNGSSSGGGNSASPAESILADAGLEVCSTEDEQIAQSTVGPDLQVIRDFDVAKSCGGKTNTPNVIRVFQFSNPQSVQEGAQAAAKEYPNGVVMISGALVIVVTGPQRDANAEAVGKAYEDSTGSPVETTS